MPRNGVISHSFTDREELVAALRCTKEKREWMIRVQEERIRAMMEEARLEEDFRELLAPDLRGAVCMPTEG